MTIFEAYNDTKSRLSRAGIEEYVFEAKQIIKHITGLNSAQIINNYARTLTPFEQKNLTEIIKQREIRYPLQYIFGEWDFYGRTFKVGTGVLVPRADTETAVDVAVNFLKETPADNILDLCAGSGCIGITLAKEFQKSKVTLVEKYPEAIGYIKKNIVLNVAPNVRVIEGDVFESAGSDGKYGLIISNPPYIPQSEMDTVSPETRFEPETALLAGDGGMEFYKAITKNYTDSLLTGGMLCYEVGFSEAERVAEILRLAGYENIKIHKDTANIDRVVSGIKKGCD